MKLQIPALTLTIVLTGVGLASAQAITGDTGTPSVEKLEGAFPGKANSPYAGRNLPDRPLFGDTHLHTEISMDAGVAGARLSPADAYVFAKGNEITASSGQQVRLSRPLDFLVVADHSENMGFFRLLMAGDPTFLADPTGRKWYGQIQSGQAGLALVDTVRNFAAGTIPEDLLLTPT